MPKTILSLCPPASAIEAMGSKSAAKHIMEKACSCLSYHGDDQIEAVLKALPMIWAAVY